jgi:hypothetical protein
VKQTEVRLSPRDQDKDRRHNQEIEQECRETWPKPCVGQVTSPFIFATPNRLNSPALRGFIAQRPVE